MSAFNVERTLARSIESVLAQTMADFELIVVDDASMDSTREVACAYEIRDPRVRMLTNKTNSRLAQIPWESRNDGIHVARAPLLAYLDADNTWDPSFLRKMTDTMRSQPETRLAYCDSKNYYADVEQLDAVLENDARPLKAFDRHQLTATFSVEIDQARRAGIDWYVDTNEIVHRRSIFIALKGLWNTYHPRRKLINESQVIRCPYRRHNDQDLVERVLREYGPAAICHVPDPLVNFFYRPECRPRIWSAKLVG
jgi:glycosyltransferase involved in cell wall biosynthesis